MYLSTNPNQTRNIILTILVVAILLFCCLPLTCGPLLLGGNAYLNRTVETQEANLPPAQVTIVTNGPSVGAGSPTVGGGSPVDNAVGAPASNLVIDQTEGGCNSTFEPIQLLRVATDQNMSIVVQAHNGPSGLRCVLVAPSVKSVNQIHALTGSFRNITEIAAIDTQADRLDPNPSNLAQCVDHGGLLFNFYTAPINPDASKIDNTICN